MYISMSDVRVCVQNDNTTRTTLCLFTCITDYADRSRTRKRCINKMTSEVAHLSVLTDMRVLDVLDQVAEAGERDAAAVELADVDQEHGHDAEPECAVCVRGERRASRGQWMGAGCWGWAEPRTTGAAMHRPMHDGGYGSATAAAAAGDRQASGASTLSYDDAVMSVARADCWGGRAHDDATTTTKSAAC